MCALDDVLLLRHVDATFDNDHSVLNEFFFHMGNRQSLCKGVIEKWYKKEGDIIKKDEVICDIRTEVRIMLKSYCIESNCTMWEMINLPLAIHLWDVNR